MGKLVDELKQEHQTLKEVLVKLQKIGASSVEGMDLLNQSKAALLAHLTKEDEQLYPPLREKAKTDTFLKNTLDTFGAEMEGITKFVLGFFEKYADNNEIDDKEFIKDVSAFIGALNDRIMKEEIAIYRVFDKLNID